jgi:hypothetical protein
LVDEKAETENYPHHKEDENVNKYFGPGSSNELTVQKMFQVKNPSEKYQTEEITVSICRGFFGNKFLMKLYF